MSFPQNLHTHTTFDDGANTVYEMTAAALEAGLDSVGFSGHSPFPFENKWTMQYADDGVGNYFREVMRVKEEFRGKIKVFRGLEFDILSDTALLSGKLYGKPDYVIGAAHYITSGNKHFCVDSSPADTDFYIDTQYHGDAIRAAEEYYASYDALCAIPEIDIVAHFDLPLKYNEIKRRFDETNPFYREAAAAAADKLIAAGKIIEINTGAISRGYRLTPYPSKWLLCHIKNAGGKINIASDSHSVNTVAFGFEDAAALARECGFTEAMVFDGDGFIPVKI